MGQPLGSEDGRLERKKMRKYQITAANKAHFESLIKDFRAAGFMLVALGNRIAELETECEFVRIEY